jgi:hypothetical protein
MRRAAWSDNLQTSLLPCELAMRPALDVCHGALRTCQHGLRVARDNITTPASKRTMVHPSNRRDRRSIRAMFL